jgi:uncharacterized protein YjbJ (UPF0337 family)
MSTAGQKAKAAADTTKGKVKEGVGRAVSNERLEAEGRADQAAGTVRHKAAQAGESVRQTAKGASGQVKETAGKAVGNESLTVKGKAEKAAADLKKKVNK